MTAVVMWKEYRQQRGLWMAIALLAMVIVVGLAETLGQGAGMQVYRDPHLHIALNLVLVSLVVTQGAVCGATAIAGEKQDGTLLFLDTLNGRRGPIWLGKAAAGALLTLSLAVVLAGLALGLGFASGIDASLLSLFGLAALAWGLLGGALCRTVLGGALTGVLSMAACGLFVLTVNRAVLAMGLTASGAFAAFASWRRFCQDDSARQRRLRKPRATAPGGWNSLLWLTYQQGRWIMAGCVVGAVILGFAVRRMPVVMWPVGTMLLGMACGLAVFTPDQGGGDRFLGTQRFHPGRIWLGKTWPWAMVLCAVTAIAWYTATGLSCLVDHDAPFDGSFGHRLSKWMEREYNPLLHSDFLLLALWPIYGFSFGHFFGLTARRPVIALILTFFVTPLVVTWWIPSLLIGGLPIWQPLVVPATLVLTARWVARPWLAQRLATPRVLTGITVASVLMVLSLAGSLWNRVAEVPDLGEPFDVAALMAELPPPEKNQAGPLIRRAVAAAMKRDLDSRPAKADTECYDLAGEVLLRGWPENDKRIAAFLDRIFEGAWVADIERAARMPLGMIQDPRLVVSDQDVWAFQFDFVPLSYLMGARALQQQARGDDRGALLQFEIILALTRQLRHLAPIAVFEAGVQAEFYVIAGLEHWLKKVGPRQELLRAALEMLDRHQTLVPGPENPVKAEYLIHCNATRPPVLDDSIFKDAIFISGELPWEKQSRLRVLRAVYAGLLERVGNSGNTSVVSRSEGLEASFARNAGLPPRQGPGSNLTARRWGEYVLRSRIDNEFLHLSSIASGEQSRLLRLRALQMTIAVCLYQAEHGKLPTTLEALVPGYLPALPPAPRTRKPFNYRISLGEEIQVPLKTKIVLVPGQALLEADDDCRLYFPVPAWAK